jgi:hypothetical protein
VPFDEPSSGISEDIDNAETAWFKVIRENANIDLHRLSGKFNQKLSDDKLELSKTDETMLTLLKDVSSIMPATLDLAIDHTEISYNSDLSA